eukprot:GGOE01042076.1.p2 GENE.GGOE01042076.1~~GGOE01042076.1.p2  ORF type:complete len:241 (+),score=75.76 GGOE01042076.1:174-896(+)
MTPVDAPPPISSGLALHACTFLMDMDEPGIGDRSILGEIIVAAPADSTQAEDFDEAQLLNFAAGHTNPVMEQRFRHIKAKAPRVSINGTARLIPADRHDAVFKEHFALHPLVVKRGKRRAADWSIRTLVAREAFYVDVDGEKTAIPLDGALYPKVAAVANTVVAQLNSRPADLVQICQKVYGQSVTRAFAHHLDDEAVYVMGATLDGWRDYVLDFGQPVRNAEELAAAIALTRRQAGLSA